MFKSIHRITNTMHWFESPCSTQYEQIKHIIADLEYTDVISTTYDSCVVIAPSEQLALIASDMLLQHGIISKTIRGHFIDCFYLQIRYTN